MVIARNPRRGFTLIELLVVRSIIGVLIALLLPAVMAARATAQRLQCKNKLKQIGLAIQTYQTGNKETFPINWGAGSKSGKDTRGHTWMTYLLPYLEESPLYDRINFGAVIGDPRNQMAAIRPVTAFICPSDSSDSVLTGQSITTGGQLAGTSYKSVAGANWNYGKFKYRKKDATDAYLRHGRNFDSYDGLEHGNGVICRGYEQQNGKPILTRMRDLRDGSSQTFAVGEAVADGCQWTSWYWWDGSTATCAIPLNYVPDGMTREENAENRMSCYSFMSDHPTGGNFLYCDGHVNVVSDDIDLPTYRAHATIDGRELIDEEN